MTTLWPIPEEAREALENGEHVRLKSPGKYGDVVIAFEEEIDDKWIPVDWEIDNGWKDNE